MLRYAPLYLLLALLFLALPATAQQKEEAKLEKWFSRGKYEKVITKATQWRRQYRKAAGLAYLQARAHFALSGTAGRRDTERQFTFALGAYQTALKLDPTGAYAQKEAAFREAMREAVVSRCMAAVQIKKRQKQARYYADWLAKYTSDTLSVWYELHTPEPEEVPEVVDVTVAEKPDYTNPSWFKMPPRKPARGEVLSYAKKLMGTRYKWGGEQPSTGFDCSGFVLHVMRRQGYDFLHGTRFSKDLGYEVNREQARPGDLVFFGSRTAEGKPNVVHMGILYNTDPGTLKVIHCVSRGVVIDGIEEGDYWGGRILFMRNIIDAREQ